MRVEFHTAVKVQNKFYAHRLTRCPGLASGGEASGIRPVVHIPFQKVFHSLADEHLGGRKELDILPSPTTLLSISSRNAAELNTVNRVPSDTCGFDQKDFFEDPPLPPPPSPPPTTKANDMTNMYANSSSLPPLINANRNATELDAGNRVPFNLHRFDHNQCLKDLPLPSPPSPRPINEAGDMTTVLTKSSSFPPLVKAQRNVNESDTANGVPINLHQFDQCDFFGDPPLPPPPSPPPITEVNDATGKCATSQLPQQASRCFQATNHNNDFGGFPLPPPSPLLTTNTVTTNDLSSHKRFITEIKLKINSSTFEPNETTDEKIAFLTARMNSLTDREPHHELLHEDSFLSSANRLSSLSRNTIRLNPKNHTTTLSNSFTEVARSLSCSLQNKQVSTQAAPFQSPLRAPYQARCQDLNCLTRLTFDNHSSRCFLPPSEQANLHDYRGDNPTPAIQTGDTSTSASIHDLLHGSSLLNLENLLKAPESFVPADDESCTMVYSDSPTDSLEYSKCWRSLDTSFTERKPPAHVGGEFNSCAIQFPAVGMQKTFCNAEVQTMPSRKSLIERGCAMTPTKDNFDNVKESYAPKEAKVISQDSSPGKDTTRQLRPAVSSCHSPSPVITYTIIHEARNNKQVNGPNPVAQFVLPNEAAPGVGVLPRSQVPTAFTTIIAADSMDFLDDINDNVVLVDDVITMSQPPLPPPVNLPNSRKFRISPLSTCRQSTADATTALRTSHSSKPFTTNATRSLTRSPPTNSSKRAIERRNSGTQAVSPSATTSCRRMYSQSSSMESFSRSTSQEHSSRSTSHSVSRSNSTLHSESESCSCSSCVLRSRGTRSLLTVRPPQVTLKKATPEKKSAPTPPQPQDHNKEPLLSATHGSVANGLNLLSFIGDKHRRELLQRWLVNQVSANVAMRIGNHVAQRFRDPGSTQMHLHPQTLHDPSSRQKSGEHKGHSGRSSSITPPTSGDKSSSASETGTKLLERQDKQGDLEASVASESSHGFSRSCSTCSIPQTVRKSQPKNSQIRQPSGSRRGDQKNHKSLNQKQAVNSPALASPPPVSTHPPPQLVTTQKNPTVKKNLVRGPREQPVVKVIKVKRPPLMNMAAAGSKEVAQSGTNNVSGVKQNSEFPYEQAIEISSTDEIARSHLNPHDRRIKSVAIKTGCQVLMSGPIKKSASNGIIGNRGDVYRLVIAAQSKERAEKCLNYLRETFPKSSLKPAPKIGG
uniref:K Homology domain-containing protein n=1 Tax=Mesocestoides corti TaxID=53468 RepID=A0A5K3FWM4_MESCO